MKKCKIYQTIVIKNTKTKIYGKGFIFNGFKYLSIKNKAIKISQNAQVGLAFKESFTLKVSK